MGWNDLIALFAIVISIASIIIAKWSINIAKRSHCFETLLSIREEFNEVEKEDISVIHEKLRNILDFIGFSWKKKLLDFEYVCYFKNDFDDLVPPLIDEYGEEELYKNSSELMELYNLFKNPKKSVIQRYLKIIISILIIFSLITTCFFVYLKLFGNDEIDYYYRTTFSLSSGITVEYMDISDNYLGGYSLIYFQFERNENSNNKISFQITLKENGNPRLDKEKEIIENSKLYYYKSENFDVKEVFIEGAIEVRNGKELKQFDISEIPEKAGDFYIEMELGDILPTKSILLTQSRELHIKRRIAFEKVVSGDREISAKFSHDVEVSRFFPHGPILEKESVSRKISYKENGDTSLVFYKVILTPDYSFWGFMFAVVGILFAVSLSLFNFYISIKRIMH